MSLHVEIRDILLHSPTGIIIANNFPGIKTFEAPRNVKIWLTQKVII